MRILGFLLVVSAFLCSFGAGLQAAEEKPMIVASTTQIADFARQVAGDRVAVKCILAPGADPHTYQPTPNDVALVLASDLCLENGLHLEGKSWMASLAKDANKPLITTTDGVKPLTLDAGGTVSPIPMPGSRRATPRSTSTISSAACPTSTRPTALNTRPGPSSISSSSGCWMPGSVTRSTGFRCSGASW